MDIVEARIAWRLYLIEALKNCIKAGLTLHPGRKTPDPLAMEIDLESVIDQVAPLNRQQELVREVLD